MKIDSEVEDLGREALVAAVAEDIDRFIAALDAIAAKGQETRMAVLRLYVAIGRAALIAIHQGGIPSERQNRELAEKAVKAESTWSPVTVEDVYALLEGFCVDDKMPDIAPERFISTLFITVNYMLSWYSGGQGYESFYDFLDAILNTIEAAPD